MNVAISQALAAGLPVITTRHSGLPEQVHDGESGFLVKEGDVEELAEKILYLIEHPDLLAVFGTNGRRHVAEHYDAGVLIEKQIDLYRGVIHQK